MMNTQTLLLLLIVSFPSWKPGDASRIRARRDGESSPYPDLVGGAAGAASALVNGILWFLQGAPGPITPTIDQNNADPQTEFQLNAETSQPPAPYKDCDPGSDYSASLEFSDNCHRTTSYLIFTKDCASLQNPEIENLLNQMELVDGWYASKNDACGSGVEFYGADLTPDQVSQFEAMITNGPVYEAVADGELANISMDIQSGEQDEPRSPSSKARLTRGEPDEVILQADAKKHLKFLSYPNQMPLAGSDPVPSDYAYFSEAGEDTVVYVIDNGANPANHETGAIQRWIYTGRIAKTETEYIKTLVWKGHGSCDVSLIAGPKYGVAKNAQVIMVKNSLTEGSVLDAFQKIINDLYHQNRERTAGYTVVTLHGGFKETTNKGSETKRRKLGEAIQTLLNVYQTVVVIPAGGSEVDEENQIFDINTYPQLFALDPLYSSMITVGAVSRETGTKFSWSKGTPGANVWAPGEAYCAYGYAGASAAPASGTSVSAAIVAGLIAYLLSLKKVGDQLRQAENIPLAVLEYVQQFSQPRDPAYPSVWNGLNSLMPAPNYGWQS